MSYTKEELKEIAKKKAEKEKKAREAARKKKGAKKAAAKTLKEELAEKVFEVDEVIAEKGEVEKPVRKWLRRKADGIELDSADCGCDGGAGSGAEAFKGCAPVPSGFAHPRGFLHRRISD